LNTEWLVAVDSRSCRGMASKIALSASRTES
jgi:hypothetical protein